MDVGIVGAGYVGLYTAAGLASPGHRVTVCEGDATRLAAFRSGSVPFRAPGLYQLEGQTMEQGRLSFHGPNAKTAAQCAVVFIAVPTPPNGDGSADTSVVESVSVDIASKLGPDAVLVLKSTYPW